MSYTIEEIEGIGPAFGAKLKEAGIEDTQALLARCGARKGRAEVAAATGIGESHLLKWANMADLMRLGGVGKQFAELLEGAGVDTIKELATRNAANLTAKMNEVNAEKRLTKGAVGEDQVQGWIDQAAGLEPAITH